MTNMNINSSDCAQLGATLTTAGSDVDGNLSAIASSIRARLSSMQRDVFQIGYDLLRAKELLGHGKFHQWLAAEFAWSARTAQNFMNVATRPRRQKRKPFAFGSRSPLQARGTLDAGRGHRSRYVDGQGGREGHVHGRKGVGAADKSCGEKAPYRVDGIAIKVWQRAGSSPAISARQVVHRRHDGTGISAIEGEVRAPTPHANRLPSRTMRP